MLPACGLRDLSNAPDQTRVKLPPPARTEPGPPRCHGSLTDMEFNPGPAGSAAECHNHELTLVFHRALDPNRELWAKRIGSGYGVRRRPVFLIGEVEDLEPEFPTAGLLTGPRPTATTQTLTHLQLPILSSFQA